MNKQHTNTATKLLSLSLGLAGIATSTLAVHGCSSAQTSGPATASAAAGDSTPAHPGKWQPAPAMPGKNVPAIKVDTVGYPVSWKKIGIFNIEPKNVAVKNEKGETVLALGADKISARGVDASSKDPVWQVDFSELKTPGRYT